ncbi:hypothetical protein VTK73DRAFT_6291 [Phialemonium thermophilum]|uniref:Uncharacterized protein n=1 Tax=Phialemonium thermophilum TaxID=223376 RepID=A0ABR3UZZ5_9PEZI
MVFVMMIVCFTTLLGTARAVTAALATQIVYPILTAMGIVSVVNVLVFPEFSGRFLGEATIDTLCLTESTLKAAVEWFLEPAVGPRGGGGRRGSQKRGAVLGDDEACSEEEDEMDITEPAPTPMSQISTTHEQQQQQQKQPPKPSQSRGGDDDKDGPSSLVARLARLTAAKGRLRAKLASCKRAYEECMFEQHGHGPRRAERHHPDQRLREQVCADGRGGGGGQRGKREEAAAAAAAAAAAQRRRRVLRLGFRLPGRIRR